MKKRLLLFVLILYGLTTIEFSTTPIVHATSKHMWEDVAEKETKKLYPLSQVLFSQKIWDKTKKDISIKQYRFTLREGMKDFAVYTTITFDSKSGEIKTIQVLPEA